MIEEEIKKRAKSYTPEWRFDAAQPDIGAAAAKVFARMMERSEKKLSHLPKKNRIAFLNSLGADLLPAVRAEGFVTFGLVNQDVSGAQVEAGTRVIAYDESRDDGQVAFETLDPVYAVPAVVNDFFYADDGQDVIYNMFDEEEQASPTVLFQKKGENLQAHEMYLSHEVMLSLAKEADLAVGLPFDAARVKVSYSTADGWEPFASVTRDGNLMNLKKGIRQPPLVEREVNGKSAHWLRFSLSGMKPEDEMTVSYPSLSGGAPAMEPDVVYGTNAELSVHRFLPFGERLDEYGEVYFGSGEVFSKRGSKVTFSFRVDFVQVPLDTNDMDTVNWEWVMERSEFRPVMEYDVSISSVMWEYFNGAGWTTLVTDMDASRVFSYEDGRKGEYVTITFTCPDDMESVMVGAIDTYYIRARIRKVNNLFKLRGQYIIPVMETVGVRYAYEAPLFAEQIQLFNNCDWQTIRQGRDRTFRPFVQMAQEHQAMYMGFDASPAGYPVKWFIEVANEAERRANILIWEFWNGRAWERMRPVDETGQLSKSGFMTLMVRKAISRSRLFGRDRYWIRILDLKDAYRRQDANPPVWKRAYLNAVKVRQIDRREQEYFRMTAYQKGAVFDLLYGNVQTEEVYVDETGQLSEEDRTALENAHRIVKEPDGDREERLWVKWLPVEDFFASSAADRHYAVHRRTGSLQFGDGVHGRIPEASPRQNIFIRYTTGGGIAGNRAIGELEQLERSIGFINSVANKTATTGGSDEETLFEAVRRMTGRIRHQNRAVSVADYEMLAFEASREILQARAFSGIGEDGAQKKGAVTLVVLDRAYLDGTYNFSRLRDKLLDYFWERINPVTMGNGNFAVIRPELITLSVYAEVDTKDYAKVFEIRRQVEERLEQFLLPKVSGEETGWVIGSFPSLPQLQNLILGTEGTFRVRNLAVKTYRYGESAEVDIATLARRAFVMPVSGSHEIIVTAL
ncbi:MAG: baseplate J/gp47 family protein [Lachnospiraceae bacterium]|nr:baseplate J/gp47 family protein [Lachnospiraceae bacterium]